MYLSPKLQTAFNWSASLCLINLIHFKSLSLSRELHGCTPVGTYARMHYLRSLSVTVEKGHWYSTFLTKVRGLTCDINHPLAHGYLMCEVQSVCVLKVIWIVPS